MPKICYVSKRFRPASLALIQHANDIIAAYTADGYRLTLRQLYYQFVAKDLIENTFRSYKRFGLSIRDARYAGLIDWNAIEDRTRSLESLAHWDDPADLMLAVSQQYRIDKWADQPVRVEVWSEKEALAGIFLRACEEMDVPFLAVRGYDSASEMWGAAQRMRGYARAGQRSVILYFGDHDPSGMDMTNDVKTRMSDFGADVEVHRLALNMDQVKKYKPPPNFAKETDRRFKGYLKRFGPKCWELDALSPAVLEKLVSDAIEDLYDTDLWEAAEAREALEKSLIGRASDRWDDVVEFLSE